MNSWMWKKTKSRVTTFHLFNTDWLQMPWSGSPLLTCRHVLLISAFIGSACRDELYSRWRRWRIVLCTTLVGVIIHICHRHAAPTQAQVRLHWTAWRSILSSVNYQRSCLSCCRSKRVEWPAKQVFKNRLKTYLLRCCYETVWLWITFPFPSHYLPCRTVVLAIVFTV